MSLDWQIQHRWGNRNHRLTPFLAISLLLHGAVFLGLAIIYWHEKSVNHPLQHQPDALLPVKFIDLPPEEVATPSPNAKYLASRNSRAGGQARRDLPVMTGRLGTRSTSSLPSSPHILAQAKPSSPYHPTQSRKLLPQQKPATPAIPRPATSNYLNSSPSVALPKPKRQPSRQPASPPAKPVVRNTEQPTPEPTTPYPDTSPSPLSDSQQPSPPASPVVRKRLLPHPPTNPGVKHTPYLPNASSLAFEHRPNHNISVPPATSTQNSDRQSSLQQSRAVAAGRQHPSTSNRIAFNRPVSSYSPTATSQLPQKSRNQLPSSQQASSLGGVVSLPSHNFEGGGDNLQNTNRTALNSVGVDTRKDDMGAYLEALRQRVAQQWRHENPESSKHTVVVFAVNRNGQITSPRLARSSGSPRIDQAALQAIVQAAPFAPLPESFPEAQLSIEFTFNILDINIDTP